MFRSEVSNSPTISELKQSRRTSNDIFRRRGSLKPRGSDRNTHQIKCWNTRRAIAKYFRLALIVVRWLKYVYFRAGENVVSLMSVVQAEDDVEEFTDGKLLFDPRQYKVQRETGISSYARQILTRMPTERSERDLAYLHVAFRRLNDYSKYPLSVQAAVCKYSWYARFGPKRAVVREGHPPINFYIILSGSLVVTIFDAESQVSRTVCFLGQGQSFGEIALATQGRRQATVVTKTTSELIGLDGSDFEKIFLAEGNGMEAFRGVAMGNSITEFVQHVRCFAHWPIELMTSYPNECFFQYFPKGHVLVANSHESDWIYVIKHGSLLVIQKIVDRCSGSKQIEKYTSADEVPQVDQSRTLRNRNFAELLNRKCLNNVRKSSDAASGRSYETTTEMLLELERRIPGFVQREDRMGLVDYETIAQQELPKVRRLTTASFGNNNSMKKISSISLTGAYLSKGDQIHPIVRDDGTVKKSVDLERREDFKTTEPNEEENLTFIKLQTLEAGQVFGLKNLIFEVSSQPVVSLVSNDAECLMISKKLFMRGASERTIAELRQSEAPYPTYDTLKSKLQQHFTWEVARRNIIRLTISKLDQSRRHKHSSNICLRK